MITQDFMEVSKTYVTDRSRHIAFKCNTCVAAVSSGHCEIYGVESWNGVLEWSQRVEFWSGTESDLCVCHPSRTGFKD